MTDTDIRAALATVYDPCSVAAGRPLSLVDMGLLLGHRREGAILYVQFAVTFAGCTMAPHFLRAAEAELVKLPGVEQVVASVDSAFAWTPERMAGAPPMTGTPQAWRRVTPR